MSECVRACVCVSVSDIIIDCTVSCSSFAQIMCEYNICSLHASTNYKKIIQRKLVMNVDSCTAADIRVN